MRRGCVRVACLPIEPKASDRTKRRRGARPTPVEAPRCAVASATHTEDKAKRNAAPNHRGGKRLGPDRDARPAAGRPERAAPEKKSRKSKMSGLIPHIKTTPYDKRFPSTNQASHCWNRYNEYVMCLKKTESDEDACKPMRQLALSICPDDWWNKWDEEREEGTFSGVKMTDASATAGH